MTADATVAAKGRTQVANAQVIQECDGLLLRGDVVAVYKRTRDSRDGATTFENVEVHIATAAKVWSIEFFNEALVHELTGFNSDRLTGKEIVIPVRVDLWTGAPGMSAAPRLYWKARRIGQDEGESAQG